MMNGNLNIAVTPVLAPSVLKAEIAMLPHPDAQEWALFLDVDGTLCNIAPSPAEAIISETLLATLHSLKSGAVALITGRDLRSLDALTLPYRFTAAGQHGFELRQNDGVINAPDTNRTEIIKTIALEAFTLQEKFTGILIEAKSASVAIHYRLAPEAQAIVQDFLSGWESRYKNLFYLQQGKMVLEIRPHGADKGAAIRHFMRTAPFAGKIPVFAGDDHTDESGFEAVAAMGGITIKVGSGDTCARYRVNNPSELQSWLTQVIETLNINSGKNI